MIYNLCRRLTGEDADDVFQDIFLDIYRSMDKFRGESSLSTWIYRIGMNHCAKHYRKKKLASLFSLQDDMAEKSASTEYRFEQSETGEILQQAIGQLPEKYRNIVVLHYFHDMKYKAIAEILSLSPKAVESAMAKARLKLSRILSQNGGYDIA